MANVLKKVTAGNPLINFGMKTEYEQYESIDNDEQLVAFYHQLLDECPEGRPMLRSFIYAMIAYSTGCNINAQMLAL